MKRGTFVHDAIEKMFAGKEWDQNDPQLQVTKQWIDDCIELQKSLRAAYEAVNGPVVPLKWIESRDFSDEVLDRVREVAEPRLTEVMAIADKAERESTQDAVIAELRSSLEAEFSELKDGAKQIGGAVLRPLTASVGEGWPAHGLRCLGREHPSLETRRRTCLRPIPDHDIDIIML